MLPPEAQSERSAHPNNEAASNQPAIQNRIHNMNPNSYSYMTDQNASSKCVYRPDTIPPAPALDDRACPLLPPFFSSHVELSPGKH